jgi:hypothetical protein
MVSLPSRDAGEFEWTVYEQSGILTTSQATELTSRGAVRGHLSLGRWRRVCHGILATDNGRLHHHQQLWVAVLTAGRGAVLAGSTALAEFGVRGLHPGPIRLLVPAARNRTTRLPRLPADMPTVRVTRTRWLPEEHLQAGRPPRTTVARAAVDAAAWASSSAGAKTILAMVCQQRKTAPDELLAVLATRRALPRRAMIAATLLDIAGGAQSLSEIDLLGLCRRSGIPRPDLQEYRKDASGRNRYLDAYWRRQRLHVEVDGAHHMDAQHWAEDMLRQNEVWIDGDRILRFPAWLIRAHPDRVVTQLRTALAV